MSSLWRMYQNYQHQLFVEIISQDGGNNLPELLRYAILYYLNPVYSATLD